MSKYHNIRHRAGIMVADGVYCCIFCILYQKFSKSKCDLEVALHQQLCAQIYQRIGSKH